jgi:beta-lactamase regulating signal transducer with metallopeptidase domain
MIAWMLYSAVAALVVACAARATETLARVLGYRLRWIWVGAFALSAFLSASSAVRWLTHGAALDLPAATSTSTIRMPAMDATWIDAVRSALTNVGTILDARLQTAANAVEQAITPAVQRSALGGWLVASLALAALFAVIIARFRRARVAWPSARLHDVPVRVSPSVGPIVIGVLRPEIVVPRWLFARAVSEQRLVVAHEAEHLRARDPLVLALAWFAVLVAPWNLAHWYMLSRLRLAIELDCDARIVERGVTPRAYGSLLIDVAQQASPLSLSALGLADESSQLYQRILALRGCPTPFARLRAAGAAGIASLGLIVACGVTPPAPAADTADAHAAKTSITTKAAGTAGEPLVFIDGVRATFAEMRALDPKRIESVEVLKGAAAARTYGDEAQWGVITVRTRSGPPPR